jgi:hypothetical protein
VALCAQLAQYLHPLPIRTVTIRARQNFVYHQNIQRTLGRAPAVIFLSLPLFAHRDCHRYLLSVSEIPHRRAHSWGSILSADQAIALPMRPKTQK